MKQFIEDILAIVLMGAFFSLPMLLTWLIRL